MFNTGFDFFGFVEVSDVVNGFTFLGGPLGFWVAQNGAIYVFVVLILIYCVMMNRFDSEMDE